ncbi:MAG: type II secretion system F family protein [Deltaproteobacteria bacterium]|nr:type II secretion system F family protein [Deltaproteobacteria bacterium]
MNLPVDFSLFLVALLAAGALLSLAGAGVAVLRRFDPVQRRLAQLGDLSPRQSLKPRGKGFRSALEKLLSMLATPARPKKEWEVSKIRRDLTQAGFYSPTAVNVYLGTKMALALLAPLVVYTFPAVRQLSASVLGVALVLGASLAFLLPGFLLEVFTGRRKERITKELPEVMDLLVIAVEAGLGLDAAIRRVGRELSLSAPVFARELGVVSLELKAGVDREKALKNLADRCGVEEVSGLVSMLNQADRFGVSVGRSLRVHSDTVRTKRRQKLEEKAAKVPLKLLFPVLFLIFPAIMVVMAGPAIIRVSETLVK